MAGAALVFLYAGAVGDGEKVCLFIVGAALNEGAEGGVFHLQGGAGGIEGGKSLLDLGADGGIHGGGIGLGGELADLIARAVHVVDDGLPGGGEILEVDDTGQVGILEAGLFGLEAAEGGLQRRDLLHGGGRDCGNLEGQGQAGRCVLLQAGQDGVLQGIGQDALGVLAAALDIVIAQEIGIAMGALINERGTAGGAADDAGEPVLQLGRGAGFIAILRFERVRPGVGGIEKRLGDQGLVGRVGENDILIGEVPAGAARGVPPEFADIDGVSDDILNGTAFERVPPVGTDTAGIEGAGDGRVALAVREGLENLLDQRGLFRDGDQHPVLHAVAEGGRGLQLALLGVDGHGALDLLGEADGVKFVHPLNDALDQRAERPGDQRLGDGHDVHAALGAEDGFIENALLLVPGKSGKLPHQEDGEGRAGLGGGDHSLELRAAVGFLAGNTGVNIDMVGEQNEAVGFAVFLNFHQLRLRGEFSLVIGGDADIGGGEHGGLGSGHGDHPFGLTVNTYML